MQPTGVLCTSRIKALPLLCVLSLILGLAGPASGQRVELLQDIGVSGGSEPEEFTAFNGHLYFRLEHPNMANWDFWRTDGDLTDVAYITSAQNVNTNASNFTPVADFLYFSAEENDHGAELWRANGLNVLQRLTDIAPGSAGSHPRYMTEYGGDVYFTADNEYGVAKLYGLETDDKSLRQLDAQNSNGDRLRNPSNFVRFNGYLWFTAYRADVGVEIWNTDGFFVTLMADVRPGPLGSDPRELTVFGNSLYFVADGSDGLELYRISASQQTNPILIDIFPGVTSSTPMELTSFGDYLYFTAITADHGRVLYRANETTNGLVTTIGDDPQDLVVYDGWLYYTVDVPTTGRELWRLDGGFNHPVADINPNGSSGPQGMTGYDGWVYFSADDGSNGRELWRTDGTTTELVKDINPGGDSNPEGFTLFDGNLYFSADDGTSGREPWLVSPNDPPVAVINAPPIAVLGADVTLSSASTDPDGDPLSVSWSLTAKPRTSALVFTKQQRVGSPLVFTPDVLGTYVVTLKADDNALTDETSVSIDVVTPETAIVDLKEKTSQTFGGTKQQQKGDPDRAFQQKLDAALASLERGDKQVAIQHLEDYISLLQLMAPSRFGRLASFYAHLIACAEEIIEALDDNQNLKGAHTPAAVAFETASAVPDRFALESAYPNPFNPTTTVAFAVPERGDVRVAVYDMLGRELAVLAAGVHEAGRYTAVFEADALPSGTYLVRMTTPEGAFTRKVLLMK